MYAQQKKNKKLENFILNQMKLCSLYTREISSISS